jgi:hypothetical protein
VIGIWERVDLVTGCFWCHELAMFVSMAWLALCMASESFLPGVRAIASKTWRFKVLAGCNWNTKVVKG